MQADYGGDCQQETPLASGWPASILRMPRSEPNPVSLPGDVRAAQWEMLLPPLCGVAPMVADIVTDDLGNRYAVAAPEFDKGWRVTLQQVVV